MTLPGPKSDGDIFEPEEYNELRDLVQERAGASSGAVVTKTASATLGDREEVVLVDASAGAVTITLPAASQRTGRRFIIIKTDASANAVTIDGNGAETINGEATTSLASRYNVLVIYSTGSEWLSTATASVGKNVVTKSSSVSLLITDEVVLADAAAAAFTLTLPTAVGNKGKAITVKKTDSTNNIVTVDGNGSETVDGQSAKLLNFPLESVTLVSDGANWQVN